MVCELSQNYRLRLMDFDRFGRMHPAAVLDIFQDIATTHADKLRIGFHATVEKGCFWAVTRMKYEVIKTPAASDVVTVRTWPHTLTHYAFMRDYMMETLNGEPLIKATSEWVMLDIKTRSLVAIRDSINQSNSINQKYDLSNERTFEKKPRKIKKFPIDHEPERIIVPAYSDIDINGHVNNARYAYFAIDTIEPCEGGDIKTFQIDYRIETLEGQQLRLYRFEEDRMIQVTGVNPNDKISFACALELR